MSNEKVVVLEFDVILEPWNRYELADGSILRTKLVLTRVEKRIMQGRTGYRIETQPINVLYNVPPHKKSQADSKKYSPEELRQSIVEEDIRYRTLAEEWAEYLLEDTTRVRIKSTILRVSQTNKVDNRGDPVYLVDADNLVEFKVRPKPTAQT